MLPGDIPKTSITLSIPDAGEAMARRRRTLSSCLCSSASCSSALMCAQERTSSVSTFAQSSRRRFTGSSSGVSLFASDAELLKTRSLPPIAFGSSSSEPSDLASNGESLDLVAGFTRASQIWTSDPTSARLMPLVGRDPFSMLYRRAVPSSPCFSASHSPTPLQPPYPAASTALLSLQSPPSTISSPIFSSVMRSNQALNKASFPATSTKIPTLEPSSRSRRRYFNCKYKRKLGFYRVGLFFIFGPSAKVWPFTKTSGPTSQFAKPKRVYQSVKPRYVYVHHRTSLISLMFQHLVLVGRRLLPSRVATSLNLVGLMDHDEGFNVLVEIASINFNLMGSFGNRPSWVFCLASPSSLIVSLQGALPTAWSLAPTTLDLPCDLLQDVRSGFVRAKQQTGALSTVWSLAPTTPGLPCDLLQDVRLGFVSALETLSPPSLPKRGCIYNSPDEFKGSAEWCCVTPAKVADFMIVISVLVAGPIANNISLCVLFVSQGIIPRYSSKFVRVRRLLNDIYGLSVKSACIYHVFFPGCVFRLPFVAAMACLIRVVTISSYFGVP